MAQPAPAPRPSITGIAHITLYADDMAKSQSFYQSLLGWKMMPSRHPESGMRYYANHQQYVELVEPPAPGRMDRLVSVGFATTDAESLRRYLGAHGIVVPKSVTVEQDGTKSFEVRDPEGNRIAFEQQGRAPAAPTKAVADPLSAHIMHAGYVVRNRAALDRFYKDVLGFHLYWQGGAKAGDIDWVMMQVPDGTDWIEYMLYLPAQPSRAQLGSADHFAPGVVSVAQLQAKLEQRGWKPTAGKKSPGSGSRRKAAARPCRSRRHSG